MKISLGKTKINILDITLIMILVFSVAGAFITVLSGKIASKKKSKTSDEDSK